MNNVHEQHVWVVSRMFYDNEPLIIVFDDEKSAYTYYERNLKTPWCKTYINKCTLYHSFKTEEDSCGD